MIGRRDPAEPVVVLVRNSTGTHRELRVVSTQQPGHDPSTACIPRKHRRWPTVGGVAAALIAVLAAAGCADSTAGSPVPPAASASTAAATTAAPAPVDEPIEAFSGRGDDVITLAHPRDFAVLDFSCTPCTGNVMLKSDADLHVNTIGSYSGKTVYGQYGASSREQLTRLQVTASGGWRLQVGGIGLAREVYALPASGHGDDALLVVDGGDVVSFAHDGKSNFMIFVTTATDSDLVVNEIGRYSGKVILPGSGRMLVTIRADGDWSMT